MNNRNTVRIRILYSAPASLHTQAVSQPAGEVNVVHGDHLKYVGGEGSTTLRCCSTSQRATLFDLPHEHKNIRVRKRRFLLRTILSLRGGGQSTGHASSYREQPQVALDQQVTARLRIQCHRAQRIMTTNYEYKHNKLLVTVLGSAASERVARRAYHHRHAACIPAIESRSRSYPEHDYYHWSARQ